MFCFRISGSVFFSVLFGPHSYGQSYGEEPENVDGSAYLPFKGDLSTWNTCAICFLFRVPSGVYCWTSVVAGQFQRSIATKPTPDYEKSTFELPHKSNWRERYKEFVSCHLHRTVPI